MADYLSPQYLVGKTIVAVDNSACNSWELTVSDPRKPEFERLLLDVEAAGYGLYGPVLERHPSGVKSVEVQPGIYQIAESYFYQDEGYGLCGPFQSPQSALDMSDRYYQHLNGDSRLNPEISYTGLTVREAEPYDVCSFFGCYADDVFTVVDEDGDAFDTCVDHVGEFYREGCRVTDLREGAPY